MTRRPAPAHAAAPFPASARSWMSYSLCLPFIAANMALSAAAMAASPTAAPAGPAAISATPPWRVPPPVTMALPQYQLNCHQPAWSREAVRYLLEGTVELSFIVSETGMEAIELTRSSGWKLLDDAVLSAMQACKREPGAPPLPGRQKMQYVMKLEGESKWPTLVKGSCLPSANFTAFRPLELQPSDGSGILMRMLVDKNGEPWLIVPEAQGQPAALLDEAARFMRSCRFTPPTPASGAPLAMLGRALIRAR